MKDPNDQFKKVMASKKFDIEHALGMHAYSFYDLPAESIYDPTLIDRFGKGVKDCHIYLIGYVPKIDLKNVRQDGLEVIFDLESLGVEYPISFSIPKGVSLEEEGGLWLLSDGSGNRYGPSPQQLTQALVQQHGGMSFEIVYVGQAYGTDGSRHAIDRLRKHETLQKIALKGAPAGYRLQLLLLEVHPSNRIFTSINSWAQDASQSDERIKSGLDKLFDSSERERITLYEAALISYFKPPYNKEFKNSFPSTNLKVLADCYDKDFSSVIAEIFLDDFHYLLWSKSVEKRFFHIVNIDLHTEKERRVFFAV